MAKKKPAKVSSPKLDDVRQRIRKIVAAGFPEHNGNPPGHLIERRLAEFVRADAIVTLGPDEVLGLLSLPIKRASHPHRWGVPAFPPGAIGDYGNLVLNQFRVSREAVDGDLLQPKLESRLKSISEHWPDLQEAYSIARSEAFDGKDRCESVEDLLECLRLIRIEFQRLRESVSWYLKWYAGSGFSGGWVIHDFGRVVYLLEQLVDLSPVRSARNDDPSDDQMAKAREICRNNPTIKTTELRKQLKVSATTASAIHRSLKSEGIAAGKPRKLPKK